MANNEFNFQRLNIAMRPMWLPITDGAWPEAPGVRQFAITLSQNLLAVEGLTYYRQREKLSGAKSGYQYFGPDNDLFRRSHEGLMTEFDAAIVLLELLRAKKFQRCTVVPAPLQFESRTPKVNVDFVFVHEYNEAVGVQVKAQVSPEDVALYDKQRVVLVDGKMDFGNEIIKKTSRNKCEQVVGWAGMICAQRMLHVNTKGPEFEVFRTVGMTANQMVKQKWLAKQLLHGIKPAQANAVQYLSQRLIPHFESLQSA